MFGSSLLLFLDACETACGIGRHFPMKRSCCYVRFGRYDRVSPASTHLHAAHTRDLGSARTAFCSLRSRTFSLNAAATTGGRLATRRFMLYRCQSVAKWARCSSADSKATRHDMQVNNEADSMLQSVLLATTRVSSYKEKSKKVARADRAEGVASHVIQFSTRNSIVSTKDSASDFQLGARQRVGRHDSRAQSRPLEGG